MPVAKAVRTMARMMFGGSARHVERMLDAAGATEAQRTQIRQIMTTAAPSMKQLREQGRVLRERTQQVMTAPVIDANAAEQLRLQMVTHHDAVLKQRLAVMLDVAQQLSPEQRAKIGETDGSAQAAHAAAARAPATGDRRREIELLTAVRSLRPATAAAARPGRSLLFFPGRNRKGLPDDCFPCADDRRRCPPVDNGRRLSAPFGFRGRRGAIAGGRPRADRRCEL